MMTFDDYKARVSIIQIAEDLGYRQDVTKGQINPVYKLKDGNGNKIDEIIIHNKDNTLQQYYYDRNHKGGDVISFVKNHIDDFPQFQHNNVFVRLNMILSNYANIPYTPKYESFAGNVEKANEFDLKRYNIKDATISDLGFLTKERGLSIDTVNKFLPFIKLVNDTHSKGNYFNVAFPYSNPTNEKNEVRNFEFRNYGFKGMAAGGDKSNSLWLADFSPDKNLANNIYFFESAIDAMSFYQLNKSKIDFDKSVFGSVGGYISENQIRNALKAYPNAKVNTGFDNDLNGNLYDIKVHNIIANMNVRIEAQKDKDIVDFTTSNRKFSLNKDEVSLNRFREESHSVAPMKTHKAVGGKDFNDVVMQARQQKTLKL